MKAITREADLQITAQKVKESWRRLKGAEIMAL
jgi:hypothetical protein